MLIWVIIMFVIWAVKSKTREEIFPAVFLFPLLVLPFVFVDEHQRNGSDTLANSKSR